MKKQFLISLIVLILGSMVLAQDSQPTSQPVPQDNPTKEQVVQFIQEKKDVYNTIIFDGMFSSVGELGPNVLARLHELMQDPSQPVPFRMLVLRAMNDLGDKAAIPYLKGYVEDIFMEDEIKVETDYILYALGETEKLDQSLNYWIGLCNVFFAPELPENLPPEMKQQISQMTPEQKTQQVMGLLSQIQNVGYRMKKYEQACWAYHQMERMGVNVPNFFYNFACSLSLAGHKEAAVQKLKMALTKEDWIKPSDIENDGDLNNIREMPEYKQLLKDFREGKPIIVEKKEPVSTENSSNENSNQGTKEKEDEDEGELNNEEETEEEENTDETHDSPKVGGSKEQRVEDPIFPETFSPQRLPTPIDEDSQDPREGWTEL